MIATRFEVLNGEPNTLRLVGELDQATVPLFEAALEAISRGDPVTLDFSELSFIDSSGLHEVSKYAAMLDGSGPLTIVNASADVRRVFEIVGLHKDDAIAIR